MKNGDGIWGGKIGKEEPLIDLLGDSVPKPLGFTAFAPEWLNAGAARCRPRHSRTWVGARVASLRCHYPPPRREQYNWRTPPNQKVLAAPTVGAVQQRQVLAAAPWPVLK